MSSKIALRMFLKNKTGVLLFDFDVYLGESIELSMLVTGVAADYPCVAANGWPASGRPRADHQIRT